ncbi:hypothetical protein AVEN_248042-1 [Araneus ventricosus]|uniref:Thyroglobulin type-1 domain-containing protein n=1 Tax=Araneus ventricosus TaxID=182803 RepID=A0A4Y2HKX5_ARAVE|nr:hypothetical protein AVEN_248042-1 [Araneus ventricosus]
MVKQLVLKNFVDQLIKQSEPASMKKGNTSMHRTVIVLAVVFISIEKVSSINNDVGTGNPKMSNCMRMNGMMSLRLFMMGMTPKCDGNGNLLPMQCFDHSEHCVCVRKDGSMLNKPSKGLRGCQCLVTKDEEENSGNLSLYFTLRYDLSPEIKISGLQFGCVCEENLY